MTKNELDRVSITGCESVRCYPPPPGFCEVELYIPINTTTEAGKQQWIQAARTMVALDPDFVYCMQPDCWVCGGGRF